MAVYLPSFTTGFLLWSFFSSSVLEATEIFRQSAGFIKQVRLPHILYVLKHLTKQIIILGHNSIVYLIITAYYLITPNINILWFIPGFLLFITNIFWICLLISMVCTRFRDMTPIINSLVQIAFFITPVSWSSQLLDSTSLVLRLNPLFYLMDIVKAPLIGSSPMLVSWVVLGVSAVVGLLTTLMLYSKKRNLIPFWVN
jgi:ABC-type polysaccharide/polyol phosphate export permease